MDYRSLHHFSRKSLKGRYGRALRASWFLLLLRLLYRLLPAGLAGLLLLRGDLNDIWNGGWLWACFLLLWMLFWEGLILPVRCAVWKRFGAWLGLTSLADCFRDARSYLHTAWVCTAAAALKAAAAFLPVAAGMLCVMAFRESTVQQEGGIWLFAAVQAFLAMLWTGIYGIRLSVALFPVPFLCTEMPDAGAVRVIRRSMQLMQGHHRTFWLIVLRYLPAMLTVVPITLLLPYLDCELMLFLQLRLRETNTKEVNHARPDLYHALG